jgi:hypothetical protein
MKHQKFAVCVKNADYPASLELRKIYAVVDDPDAEAIGLTRVIDESGDDYLYPAEFFRDLALSSDLAQELLLAS